MKNLAKLKVGAGLMALDVVATALPNSTYSAIQKWLQFSGSASELPLLAFCVSSNISLSLHAATWSFPPSFLVIIHSEERQFKLYLEGFVR